MEIKRKEKSTKGRFEKRVIKKAINIFVIIALIIAFIFIFLTNNKSKNITYKESGKADYNISISKSEFFENETLESNNQYISSIINGVNINFKYNLKMNNSNVDTKYKYRIELETKVIEKTTQNNLYDFKETLKDEEEDNTNNGKFAINSDLTIDYQKYDSIIKKLISTYELNNVNCKTVVTLYVDLLDKENNITNTSKISVDIPLNVKTVNVETEKTFNDSEEKVFEEGKTRKGVWLFLILAIVLLGIAIDKINNLKNYIKRNCPEDLLEKMKLKRILRLYKGYIQKINEVFDMTGYTILRMESFEDMLRIREFTEQPILMAENETKTKTYFIITAQNSMLYLLEINLGNVKEITD